MPVVDYIDELAVLVQNLFRGAVSSVAPSVVTPYVDLPDPPTPEPAAETSLGALRNDLVAEFTDLEQTMSLALSANGWGLRRLETRRTDKRQKWLYGIGRDYKAAGRTGIVTDVSTAHGPHGEGRAVDYNYVPYIPGTEPSRKDLQDALSSVAALHPDFTWGGNFVLSSGDHDPAHWEHA